MTSLLKRDLLINKATISVILILVPIGYIVGLPPFFISLSLLLMVALISIFYLDKRAQINRFILSLPVSRKTIIKSRYSFFSLIWVGTVFYQYIVGRLVNRVLESEIFIYGWKEVITLLSLGFIIIAIYVPIYYYFQSFVLATTFTFILYFIGFWFSIDTLVKQSKQTTTIIFNNLDQWTVPFIENTIPILPFVVLPVFALSLYYLSMMISEKSFSIRRYT
jgi:hypothetical protein